MIEIASGECGSGKTLSIIYPRILKLYSEGQPVLVVLPSLDLIRSYEQYLRQQIYWIRGQRAENWMRDLEAITSTDFDNVQAELHQSLNRNCMIILISQKAFLMSDIGTEYRANTGANPEMSGRFLIIDEAIEPYKEIAYYYRDRCQVDYKWNDTATIFDSTDAAVNWQHIRFQGLTGSSLLEESESFRNLTNTNWLTRITQQDAVRLNSSVSRDNPIIFSQELNPDLLKNWQGCLIAAANFTDTFMSVWMDCHDISYRLLKDSQFQPHLTQVEIHYIRDLHWSRYKQQNYASILEEYKRCVQTELGTDSVIVLRNSDQMTEFENEVRVKHNSHGDNRFRSHTNISLESALNLTPTLEQFLRARLAEVFFQRGIEPQKQRDFIFRARTLYTFYQSVMRSSLRDGTPARIFCLDQRVALGLVGYLPHARLVEMPITLPEMKKHTGRPQGSSKGHRAMTGPERNRYRRLRQQQRCQHLSDDELRDLILNGLI